MPLGTSHTTKTTAASFIPQLWADEVIAARENELVMAKLVKVWKEPKKKGDTVHIPRISNLTASAVTAQTENPLSVVTETKLDITIAKHFVTAILLEDIVEAQSQYDLRKYYTEKIGYALAKQADTDLLALNSGITQSVGTGGADFSIDNIRTAARILDEANAPEQDRYLIINPKQKEAIRSWVDYMHYQLSGVPEQIAKGDLNLDIFGFRVFVTNQIPVTGTTATCLAFQKEAFVYVDAQPIIMEAQEFINWNGVWVQGRIIYDVAVYRADHAVKVLARG